MFSSVIKGLEQIQQTDCFLLPIDTPCPDKTVWDSLLNELKGAQVCIPEFEHKGGHPILLGSDLIPKILEKRNDPEARLDHFLRTCNVKRVEVKDPKINFNLNTQKELEKFLNS